MPKQSRTPRTPRGTFKAWSSVAAAQRAVLRLSLKEFRKLYGVRVPRGWRQAWLNRLNKHLTLEIDARAAAQDFLRYSVATAKARAVAMLKTHGIDVARDDLALRYIEGLPPVAATLFMYLIGKYNKDPFILSGVTEDFIKPKGSRARELWRDIKSIQLLNEKEAEILTSSNTRHVVQYVVKREHSRSGVKWERTGDAGALPDITTLDGFIIATCEHLTYDAGPAEPFALGPGGRRRYDSFYATDRELAMFSVILCPTCVTVNTRDVTNGTSASTLLDQHRHKLSNKRKLLGYLETTATHQILHERAWRQPSGNSRQRSGGKQDGDKVTEKERREWINKQMQRPEELPPIRPIIPWPK
jgi:hypothetical protein